MTERSGWRKLRAAWVRTVRRKHVTEALRPRIASMGGVVLDVGGGRHAAHDEAWSMTVRRIRVDLSPHHRPDVLADAAHLPFADGSVNGTVMVETIEHLAEPQRVLDEFRRVLRPGGRVLGTAVFVAPVHGDPDDYWRFTEHGVRYLLREFDGVEVLALGNHISAAWYLLSARSRMFRLFNPVMRLLGRKPDARCPHGYVFEGTRPS